MQAAKRATHPHTPSTPPHYFGTQQGFLNEKYHNFVIFLCAISQFCYSDTVIQNEAFYTKYARAFIETLSDEAQVKLDAIVDDLATYGYLVAPYGEKVEGQKGLFEIRTKDASGQYRIFYVYADGDEVYLLNGFTKKTQKTPPAEIKKALKIKKEMGL